jgi:tRNA(fMet)-specific endonuclease VapC
MARRVILDTGVLIAIDRGKLDVGMLLGNDDAAIAAVTAVELLVHVEALLSSLPIETYDLSVARIHARLAVEAMSIGKPRSAYDMLIAATAAATNRVLLTTDGEAGFDQLSGVRSEVLTTR